ncbi:MAG: GTPase ObgE [Hymenobacter sp.]
MFWDNVEIEVKAGAGGAGMASFRTELREAKGGPDGGDGGNGGSVTVRADHNLNTLVDYARRRTFAADAGRPGGRSRRHGKSAPELELAVPVGTLMYAGEKILTDLTEPGQTVVLAKGGRGGFGNAHFTSSIRQTPRMAELGEPGEERAVRLELKLVADIGLVGIPSVGKSTLLSRWTAAKPKIADYPFTTTVPQLGIATVDDRSLVVADIPGLVEGAHQGKGLGDAFLRHIERTKLIVHLLDATRPDPVVDYRQTRHELESYSTSLAATPEVIAVNKADTLDDELGTMLKSELEQRLGQPVWLVSGVSGAGLTELLRQAAALITEREESDAKVSEAETGQTGGQTISPGAQDTAQTGAPTATFTLADLAPNAVSVRQDNGGYVVANAKLERLASQTDFANHEAAQRFWWVFERMGAAKQLEKLGAKPGALVQVGRHALRWKALPGRASEG